MKIPKHISTAMAITMVAGSVVISPVSAATSSNESLIGKNRIETAIKISKDGWKSAETVILVNDSAIPDALTATPLAHAKNAPILLTGKDGLKKETADEIKRLGAKDVIMIGGDAVLPEKIEKDIKALNIKVDRVKGATREETALEIAKRLDGIKDVSEIAVVNGTTGLADAVSIAAAAAEKGMPILLANPKSGLSVAEKFIKDESIKSSFIIGGNKAVADSIVANLPGKQRIEGSNRNDTNAKVIEKFYADRNLDNLYLAKDGMSDSGQLIDALAVGALAAKNGAPVLIASKKLSETQKKVINTKRVDTITQVGGNGNEKAFGELKDIEKETVYKVKNEAELQEALKKADANDIIELESSVTISNDVSIKTDNAVDVVIKGDCTGIVTVETPNANIENSGNIGTLVVENGKNTTVTNTSSGKIDKVEVDSSSENVKVENNGKIDKVENNASGTNIENNGTISKPITGTTTPNVEGNKPGGGSSSGGTVIPSIGVESIKITGVKPIEVGTSLKLNAEISPSNATNKVVSWSSSDDKIATVDSDGNVKAVAKGEVNITASCGGKSETVKVYVAEKLIESSEELTKELSEANDNDVLTLAKGNFESNYTIDKNITVVGSGDSTVLIGETTLQNGTLKNLMITPTNEKSDVLYIGNSSAKRDINMDNVTVKYCSTYNSTGKDDKRSTASFVVAKNIANIIIQNCKFTNDANNVKTELAEEWSYGLYFDEENNEENKQSIGNEGNVKFINNEFNGAFRTMLVNISGDVIIQNNKFINSVRTVLNGPDTGAKEEATTITTSSIDKHNFIISDNIIDNSGSLYFQKTKNMIFKNNIVKFDKFIHYIQIAGKSGVGLDASNNTFVVNENGLIVYDLAKMPLKLPVNLVAINKWAFDDAFGSGLSTDNYTTYQYFYNTDGSRTFLPSGNSALKLFINPVPGDTSFINGDKIIINGNIKIDDNKFSLLIDKDKDITIEVPAGKTLTINIADGINVLGNLKIVGDGNLVINKDANIKVDGGNLSIETKGYTENGTITNNNGTVNKPSKQ